MPTTISGRNLVKTVPVNGVDLAYEVYGSGSQDLLFVHGFMGQGALYRPLLNELAPYFRVIALDCRAHGNSSKITHNVTTDQLSDDILAVTSALDLRQPIYAGHSMGGMLGLVSTIKEPHCFKGVVAITPGPRSYDKLINLEIHQHRVRAHQNRSFTPDDWKPLFVKEISDEDLVDTIESAYLVDPAVHEYWLMVERRKENPIFDRLSEIEVPILFLNGALDAAVPVEEQHQMALAVPHCKEVTFTDEGHMLPAEAPQRTAVEITRFYEDISSEGAA